MRPKRSPTSIGTPPTTNGTSSPIPSPLPSPASRLRSPASGLPSPASRLFAAAVLALAAALLLASCSETDRKGIGRLVDVGYDVADGQRDYYGPSRLDTDGDGVPNDVDRHPMDPDSVYFPNDNREEDRPHE